MPRPLVSVIVPTFNCGAYIATAIDSILSQDYAPMEVLAVDDGSTDNTLDVLATYGERIRVFRQANAGPAAARNRACREARGDWLAFLDGDDCWLPGQPSLVIDYAQRHPDTKVAYGGWLVWNAQADGSYAALPPMPRPSEPASIDPQGSGWLYPHMLFDSAVHIIACVLRREVYDAVGGFDESLRTGSDYDFWLKVSRKFPIVKIDAVVAAYRQNPASVTHTVRPENNAYRLLSRAVDTYGVADEAGHAADAAAVQRRLADIAFNHAYRHFWKGDPRIAQASCAQALRHHPLHAKALAYWFASLAKRAVGGGR